MGEDDIGARIHQPEITNNAAGNRGRSVMDVEERTRSLTQSYFETEKEEELYNNQRIT
jgi:hypothetical protein